MPNTEDFFGTPEVTRFGAALATVLEAAVPLADRVEGFEAGLKRHMAEDGGDTPFLQLREPPCSIRHYIGRITKYAGLSENALVCTLALLNRSTQDGLLGLGSSWCQGTVPQSSKEARAHAAREPPIRVCRYNVHRLVLVCALAAAKYNDELICSNAHWAKVGGVSTEELNLIERAFFDRNRFRLGVGHDCYALCRRLLQDVDAQGSYTPRPRAREEESIDCEADGEDGGEAPRSKASDVAGGRLPGFRRRCSSRSPSGSSCSTAASSLSSGSSSLSSLDLDLAARFEAQFKEKAAGKRAAGALPWALKGLLRGAVGEEDACARVAAIAKQLACPTSLAAWACSTFDAAFCCWTNVGGPSRLSMA